MRGQGVGARTRCCELLPRELLCPAAPLKLGLACGPPDGRTGSGVETPQGKPHEVAEHEGDSHLPAVAPRICSRGASRTPARGARAAPLPHSSHSATRRRPHRVPGPALRTCTAPEGAGMKPAAPATAAHAHVVRRRDGIAVVAGLSPALAQAGRQDNQGGVGSGQAVAATAVRFAASARTHPSNGAPLRFYRARQHAGTQTPLPPPPRPHRLPVVSRTDTLKARKGFLFFWNHEQGKLVSVVTLEPVTQLPRAYRGRPGVRREGDHPAAATMAKWHPAKVRSLSRARGPWRGGCGAARCVVSRSAACSLAGARTHAPSRPGHRHGRARVRTHAEPRLVLRLLKRHAVEPRRELEVRWREVWATQLRVKPENLCPRPPVHIPPSRP